MWKKKTKRCRICVNKFEKIFGANYIPILHVGPNKKSKNWSFTRQATTTTRQIYKTALS